MVLSQNKKPGITSYESGDRLYTRKRTCKKQPLVTMSFQITDKQKRINLRKFRMAKRDGISNAKRLVHDEQFTSQDQDPYLSLVILLRVIRIIFFNTMGNVNLVAKIIDGITSCP